MNIHEQKGFIASVIFGFASPFIILLWIMVFYYFANCLYSDRKDGSVLFWQSMPVSETKTIISKLIAGLVLAPIFTWICIVVTEIAFLIIASIALPWLNLSYVLSYLWQPGMIVISWLALLFTLFLQGLWLSPLLAWFMLCSAFAKRAPLLYAIVPILLIVIIESMFNLRWGILQFIANHFTAFAALTQWLPNLLSHQPTLAHGTWFAHMIVPKNMSTNQYAINFIIGIVVAIIFVGIAGILRRRCYDFER